MATAPVFPPARQRRRWRWVALMAAVALAVLVGWLLFGRGSLARAVADADRLDPGWRWEELQAKRAWPPEGQNAADAVLAAAPVCLAPRSAGNLDELLGNLPANRRLTAAQKAVLAGVLPNDAKALALVRRIADLPEGRYKLAETPDRMNILLPFVEDIRTAAALARLDMLDRADAGDTAGAVRAWLAQWNAVRSVGDEPIGVLMSVRAAWRSHAIRGLERLLAQVELDDATLSDVSRRLAEEEAVPLLLIAARGERALADTHMRYVEGNYQRLAKTQPATPAQTIAEHWQRVRLFLPGEVATRRAGMLDIMNRVVEAAKRPVEDHGPLFEALEPEIKAIPHVQATLASMLAKNAVYYRRSTALCRCAFVAVAAERYRLRHGRWPTQVADLSDGGRLISAMTDPFDGQPVRIKAVHGGLIVYTVGDDRTDDGGQIEGRPEKSRDLGLRLYDPSQRRLPPLPTPPAGGTP